MLAGAPLVALHLAALAIAPGEAALWRLLALYALAGACIGVALAALALVASPVARHLAVSASGIPPHGARAVFGALAPMAALVTVNALLGLAGSPAAGTPHADLGALPLIVAAPPPGSRGPRSTSSRPRQRSLRTPTPRPTTPPRRSAA